MKTIGEIISEKIQRKYRKRKNSTKALKKDNTALKGLFMDIVKQENQEISDIELEQVEKYFDEFLKEEDFKV
jgi:hypothetical protein